MTLTDLIISQITLQTFNNIWYWLAVAVTWGTVTHWIIGVPFDIILGARRGTAQAVDDLEQLTRINLHRLGGIAGAPALVLAGLGAFLIVAAGMLGFVYGLELAQGMFLLVFPLAIVAGLTWRSCRQMLQTLPRGADLVLAYVKLRFRIQLVAMASIFVTAMVGMYANLIRLAFF